MDACSIGPRGVHRFVVGSECVKERGLLVLFCEHCATVAERIITDPAITPTREDSTRWGPILAPGGSD